jgi:dihydrolipoamide dehydrogenase
MSLMEIKIPDIGDFKSVDVTEILVKPGDRVEKESSLITVESDKSSMEIPSPVAGVVQGLRVRIGDKVSEGTVIVVVDASDAVATPPAPAAAAPSAPAAPSAVPSVTSAAPVTAAPAAAAASVSTLAPAASYDCDLLVLGAGPGGYSAAFRAADLGQKVILVERYSTLGGVCLNVGCIPSKALLHAAKVVDDAASMAEHGISFGAPRIDMDKLRDWKSKVVGKLTTGLAGMAKARKVSVLQGTGQFTGPHSIELQQADGKRSISFASAIIAVGSQASKVPGFPEDSRIMDSTGALELRQRPKRMLVIGGGIIGLEMGTVYSTLGARLDVVEMADGLMMGADRDLVAVWQKFNAARLNRVMLKTRTAKIEAQKEGIKVWFEGEQAPKEPQMYDLVLVSVGRAPNGGRIQAEAAGVTVTERGFIPVDSQMRTNVPHIFAIGDVVGQPMLAHKAVHEGHVAAEAVTGLKSHFDARVIPSVAYVDPEIAWSGVSEEEAKKQGLQYSVGKFPWAASGRAIANGRDEGFTKLLFDEQSHRIIGGGIVGTGAGDLISEVALAIEMGADALDIGKTIHPHPTLGESIGMAAEVWEGVCTDLPPMKKR